MIVYIGEAEPAIKMTDEQICVALYALDLGLNIQFDDKGVLQVMEK